MGVIQIEVIRRVCNSANVEFHNPKTLKPCPPENFLEDELQIIHSDLVGVILLPAKVCIAPSGYGNEIAKSEGYWYE